jgi:site-specific recombinase XerD
LPGYQATRHTFASHYVMEGGSIEVLKALLGHSTILMTERYAHLLPSRSEADRGRFTVELTA